MPSRHRDRFRADHVGFVFQMFNLVPYLSMIDNVTLPCRFSSRRQGAGGRAGGGARGGGAPAARPARTRPRGSARARGHRAQHRPAAARRRGAGAHRSAGADRRRRADLRTRRRHARALPRSPVRAVRRGGRVAALREPRHPARRRVRPPGVPRGTEPRRVRSERSGRLMRRDGWGAERISAIAARGACTAVKRCVPLE